MNERIIVALVAFVLLPGCSEQDNEQSRYTRESLQRVDKNCIKGAVEAQMQQAADYSRSRINSIRDDSAAVQKPADVTGAIFGDCFEDASGSK